MTDCSSSPMSWCSRMPVATLTFSESTPTGANLPGAAAGELMRSTVSHIRRTAPRRPLPSFPITRIVGRSGTKVLTPMASSSFPAPAQNKCSLNCTPIQRHNSPAAYKQHDGEQREHCIHVGQQIFYQLVYKLCNL